MKITKGHAVSLGLNGLLLALVLIQWCTSAPDTTTSQASITTLASSPTAGTTTINSAPTEPTPVRIGAGWPQWIESLRGAGAPADVLAGLVREDFDHRWQTREAEMQRRYMQGHADADALAAFALDHDALLETELRSALGADEFRRWETERVLQSLNVSQVQLSSTERNAVYELERGLQDDLRKLQSDKLRGIIDQSTLNSREQSMEAAVAQQLCSLLGEQRAALLNGADDTLGILKHGLSAVPLSGAQLTALADVQRSWDQTRSQLAELQNNTGDPAYAEAILQAEEKWRREFQQIAGADAFDTFLKSQDSRYADLRRFAASWQISPTEIDGIFDSIGNYDQTVREYGLDAQAREVDPAAAGTVLGKLQQDTERTLQERLGAERYAELKRNDIVP